MKFHEQKNSVALYKSQLTVHFRLGSNSHYYLNINNAFCLNKLLIIAY